MFDRNDGRSRPGANDIKVWIECRKCRATMFSTFDTCWSCGAEMDDANRSTLTF